MPLKFIRGFRSRGKKWQKLFLHAGKNDCQSSDSNARKRRSSSHCCCALSLDLSNTAQRDEGLSAPRTSCEHPETARVKASGAFHKLAPGKKLCSMLVRTIRLRSAYLRS